MAKTVIIALVAVAVAIASSIEAEGGFFDGLREKVNNRMGGRAYGYRFAQASSSARGGKGASAFADASISNHGAQASAFADANNQNHHSDVGHHGSRYPHSGHYDHPAGFGHHSTGHGSGHGSGHGVGHGVDGHGIASFAEADAMASVHESGHHGSKYPHSHGGHLNSGHYDHGHAGHGAHGHGVGHKVGHGTVAEAEAMASAGSYKVAKPSFRPVRPAAVPRVPSVPHHPAVHHAYPHTVHTAPAMHNTYSVAKANAKVDMSDVPKVPSFGAPKLGSMFGGGNAYDAAKSMAHGKFAPPHHMPVHHQSAPHGATQVAAHAKAGVKQSPHVHGAMSSPHHYDHHDHGHDHHHDHHHDGHHGPTGEHKAYAQAYAAADGTFAPHGVEGLETSHYKRSTDNLVQDERGHIDDNHYYNAQSYDQDEDESLNAAYNKDDEDEEHDASGYRRSKRGENYVVNYNKSKRERGSGLVAKDNHSSSYNKSKQRLREEVDQAHRKESNGVVEDESMVSSHHIDDEDDHIYDSDVHHPLAPRFHKPAKSYVTAEAAANAQIHHH